MTCSGHIHRHRPIMSAQGNKEPSMRRVLPLKIALASLLIAACVTINVYFPAAAADKAADQVIDNITKGTTTPPTGYRAPERSSGEVLLAAVGNVGYAMITAANAQG